jgi:hypothetical protein
MFIFMFILHEHENGHVYGRGHRPRDTDRDTKMDRHIQSFCMLDIGTKFNLIAKPA